jgi:hypothetical protein
MADPVDKAEEMLPSTAISRSRMLISIYYTSIFSQREVASTRSKYRRTNVQKNAIIPAYVYSPLQLGSN